MEFFFNKVFFTDQKRCGDIKGIIKKLPKNSCVIFREYHLESKKREELAREIFVICRQENHKFLIGKDLDLARKLGADGVHFSDFDKLPQQILNRGKNCKKFRDLKFGLKEQNRTSKHQNQIFESQNLPEKFIFSYACHNFFSVLKSRKLKPDLIFITPIFKTKSHESARVLGLFKAWFFKLFASSPVFALGGINEKNFKMLKMLGFQGFGGIEIFIK